MTDPIVTDDLDPPADPAPPEPTAKDDWLAQGHQIIRDNLARARAVGSPIVAQLLPTIEATFHDLLSHMMTSPDDYAAHKAAVAAQADADRAHAKAEADRVRGVAPPPADAAPNAVPSDPDGIDTFGAAVPDPVWAAGNDTVAGGSLFDPDPSSGPPTPRPAPPIPA